MKRRWLVFLIVLSMAMVSVGVTSAVPQSAGEETSNVIITDRLPGEDIPGPWPTWIEGPDNTILMSFVHDGKVQIASSQDTGRSWQVYATIQAAGRRFRHWCSGYFTRISETRGRNPRPFSLVFTRRRLLSES